MDSNQTPISQISVALYSGDPCRNYQYVKSVQTDTSGNYTIDNITNGKYYLKAQNQGQNYVNKWWNDGGGSYKCKEASLINVYMPDPISNVNFTLNRGGIVTGTVYKESGAPVTDSIQVQVYYSTETSICENREWINSSNTNSSDGTYSIPGIPAGEKCYIGTRADTKPYADEWWASSASSYFCADAQYVMLQSEETSTGKNFQLSAGGKISGRVVLKSNDYDLTDVTVRFSNDANNGDGKDTKTASNGTFTFSNIPPGPAEIEVIPGTSSKLVNFRRQFWVNENENKFIGTIKLISGAKVYGYVKNTSDAGIPDFHLSGGNKYRGVSGDTYNDNGGALDGYFEVRLPVDKFSMGHDEGDSDPYRMMPIEFQVNSLTEDVNLGNLTAYDPNNAGRIVGMVNTNALSHSGKTYVGGFKSNWEPTPDIWGGWSPAGGTQSFDINGNYELYVPPGQDVNVGLIFFTQDKYRKESVTIINSIPNVFTTSGQTTSVDPLNYTSEGVTLQGVVENRAGRRIFNSNILLYNQPGDKFAGFGTTGYDGKFIFYNVQPGTYRIAVSSYDYDTVWTQDFDISSQNITLPIIHAGLRSKLAVDFGSTGLWTYDNCNWTKIYGSQVAALIAYGKTIIAKFNDGYLYIYDNNNQNWINIVNTLSEDMIIADSYLYVDFGSNGVHKYIPDSNKWNRVSTGNPSKLVSYSEKLVGKFGDYLYEYDGITWTKIATTLSEDMIGLGSNLFVDFGTQGVYRLNSGKWTRIATNNPTELKSYGSKLVGKFSGYLYEFDGSTWTKIATTPSEDMIGIGSALYVDFGTQGVHRFKDGKWFRVATNNPTSLQTYNNKLVGRFSGYLYEYDPSTNLWTRIATTPSDKMIGIE
ncbi:MAG: carboxypeptidase regulatory-like domain-containing protein [Desulfobacterales bacterium]|nr:carboxypeptidase regulatory-like domain-containing protein [Desulfobacterales bacterium]